MAAMDRAVRELLLDATEGEGKATFEVTPLTKTPAGLPPAWRQALISENPVSAVLDVLWKPLAKKYPKTLRGLRRTLQKVGLLSTPKAGHSLVYLFDLEDDGGPTLRRGYPPAKKLPKVSSRLPADFLALYAVHDGWLDEWKMMGPRRSAEWGPLGTSGPSREFLVTFEGHGPGSLGFDLSEPNAACYTVWNYGEPERARNVASRIDDWMATRMEEFVAAKAKSDATTKVKAGAKPKAKATTVKAGAKGQAKAPKRAPRAGRTSRS